MAQPVTVVAVDLGATSGRVMIGRAGPDELRLDEVARFPNTPVRHDDGLHWDYSALREHVLDGLRSAGAAVDGGPIDSIGIDAWAADYGLLDAGEKAYLLDDPFHYRDPRTAAGVAAVHAAVPFETLRAQNGLQFLPFNTLYQLAVDRDAGRLARARTALLIADLVGFELTGMRVAEVTNASTTGLLTSASSAAEPGPPQLEGRRHQHGRAERRRSAASHRWNDELITALGLPRRIFPPLVAPGERIGALTPPIRRRLGFDSQVLAVGSHDTASAVVATPMKEPDSAFISCGTWGLVGVELENPVVSVASGEANFTNELGVDGRIRFLRNVMGMWLLNESMSSWAAHGMRLSLPAILDAAEAVSGPVPVFDVDDPRFLAPNSASSAVNGEMPARIVAWYREHGMIVPRSPAEFTRCIVESLAVAFAGAVRRASELSGKRVGIVHLVGGGAQNALLCRCLAAQSGLPVVAGPAEATALGNVLVQARALGAFGAGARGRGVSLEAMRSLVSRTTQPLRYEPAARLMRD